MLTLFKSRESKDFETAMDFLECSRTLMGSAIETHRAIVECQGGESDELLAVAAVVRPSGAFLRRNIELVRLRIEKWKSHMQLQQPERYSKVARIVNNAEKNIRHAAEKAGYIDYWIHSDMFAVSRFE